MVTFDFEYSFRTPRSKQGARNAFTLASLAVRSQFQVDHASVNTHVRKGENRILKSISASGRIGTALAAIFNGILAESLSQDA